LHRRWQWTIVVILIILILGISVPYFRKSLKSAFNYISNPVINIFVKAGQKTKTFFSVIGKINKLANENENLKKELLDRKKEEAQIEVLKNENLEFAKQLKYFQENPDIDFITGRIVYKDPSRLQNYLTINIGEKDGVQKDMSVVSQGYLIGKITEVNNNSSKVFLITNSNSSISALVLPSQALGLIRGQLGYGLKIESLPKDAKISTSDYVVTSGMGDYSKGLIIGEISEIISNKNDVFQSANVKPMFDYSTLEIISVIK